MAPHPSIHASIRLSTAFSPNLSCFSPSEIHLDVAAKNMKWKQGTAKCIGVTLFEETNTAPDISTWGETKQNINKKQLQPLTWFCLLFSNLH